METLDASTLFRPFVHGPLALANRIVMAPMTRCHSPGGVPGGDVAAYYRRRAAAGVGLIITEGAWVPHPTASNDDAAPRFHGADALSGWAEVVRAVHAVGGRIAPQLWHVGLTVKQKIDHLYDEEVASADQSSPSGYWLGDVPVGRPATENEIGALIDAYAEAAASARHLGFDAVEVHGAHGYLVDQFFWHATNRRTDDWGGRTLAARARFGAELVRAMRRRVGPDFPIIFRFSQWKQQDYGAMLATTPAELAGLLEPLADAGVDIFHASQRRFWEPAFDGDDRNLAGWAQRLSGRPAITVGSVGLDLDLLTTMFSADTAGIDRRSLDRLVAMMERGDFDLVAVGRALIADPAWVGKLRTGRTDAFIPYAATMLATLE